MSPRHSVSSFRGTTGTHVALATNGVYKVTQLSFTAHDLTVDFRGARLRGSQKGAHGILRVQTSRNVVLNDPRVSGTGYVWDDANQAEAGIQIDGGSDITLNRPITRDTRGDGIYVGYQQGKNSPAIAVVINRPNIERAARNGIAPVAGQVTIRGGHIARTGLHARRLRGQRLDRRREHPGVVDGVDIRHHGDLPAASASCTCYAVAAEGFSDSHKAVHPGREPDGRQSADRDLPHSYGRRPEQRLRRAHYGTLPWFGFGDLQRQYPDQEAVKGSPTYQRSASGLRAGTPELTLGDPRQVRLAEAASMPALRSWDAATRPGPVGLTRALIPQPM